MSFWGQLYRNKGLSTNSGPTDPSGSRNSNSDRSSHLDVVLSKGKVAQESKRKKKIRRQRLEDCCAELIDVLTPEICNKLADYFAFNIEQKAFRKSPNFIETFVETLKEDKLIRPNESTLLEHALEHIGENILASRVKDIFRDTFEDDGFNLEELHWLLANILKRRYTRQCQKINPRTATLAQEYCINELYIDGRVELLITDDDGSEFWKELETYHNIASIASENERVLVEGDAGYGKSMLVLQLLYEWCEGIQTSPMSRFDFVIFLQLEKVERDPNVYHAIKRVLLPDESLINVKKLEYVIRNCSSVMFLLDGFDKVTEGRSQWISKFLDHDAKAMQFPVVITSRPGFLPSKYLHEMQRLRLSGFETTTKETYMRKVLDAFKKNEAEETWNKISTTVCRSSFFNIPILFSGFSLMVKQHTYLGNASALTSIFSHIIASIIGNAKSKTRTQRRVFLVSRSLSKVAYDTVIKSEATMVYTKEVLTKKIGKEDYNFYTEIGILREERMYPFKQKTQSTDYYNFIWRTDVSFRHSIFCEWYAAQYIVLQGERNALSYLQFISPLKFPNVFRFCCGLKPSKADKIIYHIKQYAGGDTFALLCSIEQHGSFVNAVKESVIDLCSQGVTFSIDDSRLMQRSMMEIMELASMHEISVAFLHLTNCLDFSHLYDDRLFLFSGEVLSSQRLKRVGTIQIIEQVRRLDYQQTEKILKFAMKCSQLTTLIFLDSLPPWDINKPGIVTSAQRTQRNLEVFWTSRSGKTYQLNMSGFWELNGVKLPLNQYNEEVCSFEKQRITQTSSRQNRP